MLGGGGGGGYIMIRVTNDATNKHRMRFNFCHPITS